MIKGVIAKIKLPGWAKQGMDMVLSQMGVGEEEDDAELKESQQMVEHIFNTPDGDDSEGNEEGLKPAKACLELDPAYPFLTQMHEPQNICFTDAERASGNIE